MSRTAAVCFLLVASQANNSAAQGPASSYDLLETKRLQSGEIRHRIRSSLQKSETHLRVLVPDKDGRDRFRLLYVLPVEAGLGTHWGDAVAEIQQLDLHNRFGLVCVYPTFSDLPWYADHPSETSIAQETYFLKAVVPLAEKLHGRNVKPKDRLLVGFSKSGWGAFSLLLRHQDRFGRAAAWDAPLMMDAPGKYGSGPIFGTPENFRKYELTRLLRADASAWKETPRLIHLGYGNFRSEHVRFESLLNELDVSHVHVSGPKRKHAWGSGWLEPAVQQLVK